MNTMDAAAKNVDMRPVNQGDLVELQKYTAQLGMPRSLGYFNRMFFEPEMTHEVEDKSRGLIMASDDGKNFCFECYYYTRLYSGRIPLVGHSMCFLGATPKYGLYLLKLLAKINSNPNAEIIYSNTVANPKSASIAKTFRKMQTGPERCGLISTAYTSVLMKMLLGRYYPWKLPKFPTIIKFVWSVLAPFSLAFQSVVMLFENRMGFKINKEARFTSEKFEDFWQRFLESNDGIITSRQPSVLQWMFGDALKAGVDVLITAQKNDKILGYILLRKYMLGDTGFFWRYKIIDVCAVGNDYTCLRVLVLAAKRYAALHKGIRVQYIGGNPGLEKWLDPILNERTKLKCNSTIWQCINPEIRKILEENKKGWFFGPLDGERCFGHMGYVDI